MAHSSLPIYLDPPNWQQSNQQPTNDQDPRRVPPFLPPPPASHLSSVASSVRPGSMAYRARLAMIPQPEMALKCPRCESTNTKFCYFNNYSLSQPRHFCKTCRRYWTRGGALRNVPVGGGFRKNKKKKKSNRSKSPTATESEMGISRSASATNIESSSISHLPSQPPQLPLLTSLHNLSRFGTESSGLNFNAFQIGNLNSTPELDQWRPQQSPFIVTGIEPPTPLHPFIQTEPSSSSAAQYCHQLQSSTPFSRFSQQLQKNEGQEIPIFLRPPVAAATVTENSHFWAGDHQSSWTDLSAISSSSSSHLL